MLARGPARGPSERRRATLAAVTARSEAPASFRSSSVRPGSLDLVAGGVREVLSRRRLIAYMVRADLKKKGADTLLGNVWWVIDPLVQMLIYSVLVTIVFDRGVDDYGLFVFTAILPWKWFESTVRDGVNRGHGPGAADQADLLPEAGAARLGGGRGRRQLRLRAHPARRPDVRDLLRTA